MPERPSVLSLPKWLIAVDGAAAVLVACGLVLRHDAGLMARLGLPTGTDLLLLGIGALAIAACAVQFGRIALAAAASKSSR